MLLDCPLYAIPRDRFTRELMEHFNYMTFSSCTRANQVKLMLYGDSSLSVVADKQLANAVAAFIDDLIEL